MISEARANEAGIIINDIFLKCAASPAFPTNICRVFQYNYLKSAMPSLPIVDKFNFSE